MEKNRLFHFIAQENMKNSEAAMSIVKKAMIDVVGCAIAGSQTEEAKFTKDFAMEVYNNGHSSILLSWQKINAVGAAFVNAKMASVLNLNDSHQMVRGQLGSIIFPAVMAAAEDREISGGEFLSAVLAGYEVAIRAEMIGKEINTDVTSIRSWTSLGALAGVSKIIGLSSDALENAIGIHEHYLSYSPVMNSIDPMEQQEVVSWLSMAGVNAAYLAEKGYKRNSRFFSILKFNDNNINQKLGEQYLTKQLLYKSHSCNRFEKKANETFIPFANVTDLEVKQKFMELTSPVIGKERSFEILNLITNIERLKNMREFTSYINQVSLMRVV